MQMKMREVPPDTHPQGLGEQAPSRQHGAPSEGQLGPNHVFPVCLVTVLMKVQQISYPQATRTLAQAQGWESSTETRGGGRSLAPDQTMTLPKPTLKLPQTLRQSSFYHWDLNDLSEKGEPRLRTEFPNTSRLRQDLGNSTLNQSHGTSLFAGTPTWSRSGFRTGGTSSVPWLPATGTPCLPQRAAKSALPFVASYY